MIEPAYKTFDEAVKALALEQAELVIRKQRDYGTGNILQSPAGAEGGIVVRLGDKLNRIYNLLKNGVEPENESLEDSWRDVVGYGLVALMVRRGYFTIPLEKKND